MKKEFVGGLYMFDQIFGNYLVATKRITKEQLKDVIAIENTIRVKLGLIAVAEKLMTTEQADEVNNLQAIMDRRFGDIAVEKGYLTEEQVIQLLKKQGNIYLIFVQTLIDKDLLTLSDIEAALAEYQQSMGFTATDMDDLVSGDIERTVNLFLPTANTMYSKLCGIAVRTLIRIIHSGAYVSKAFLVDEIYADNLAIQHLDGDFKVVSGFAGADDSLLSIAVPFAKEEFASVDMDALDAVGEFTNCINGLFASDLSKENIEIDMLPPLFYDESVTIKGNKFCVFPMSIEDNNVSFIVSVDEELTIE